MQLESLVNFFNTSGVWFGQKFGQLVVKIPQGRKVHGCSLPPKKSGLIHGMGKCYLHENHKRKSNIYGWVIFLSPVDPTGILPSTWKVTRFFSMGKVTTISHYPKNLQQNPRSTDPVQT